MIKSFTEVSLSKVGVLKISEDYPKKLYKGSLKIEKVIQMIEGLNQIKKIKKLLKEDYKLSAQKFQQKLIDKKLSIALSG